jgi:hypothetical protein
VQNVTYDEKKNPSLEISCRYLTLTAMYRVEVVENRANATENRVIAVLKCLVFLASHV